MLQLILTVLNNMLRKSTQRKFSFSNQMLYSIFFLVSYRTSSPNAYDWNLLFLGEPKYAFYQDPPASGKRKHAILKLKIYKIIVIIDSCR